MGQSINVDVVNIFSRLFISIGDALKYVTGPIKMNVSDGVDLSTSRRLVINIEVPVKKGSNGEVIRKIGLVLNSVMRSYLPDSSYLEYDWIIPDYLEFFTLDMNASVSVKSEGDKVLVNVVLYGYYAERLKPILDSLFYTG